MSRPNKDRRFAPSLLTLEDRSVPAGNVTATLVGDQLRVFGDAADNSVVLRGHGPNVVEVRGIGTTVNGGKANLTFSGVSHLWVRGGDGNDTLKSQDLSLGDIFIAGGSGDDVVRIADTSNGGQFVSINVNGDDDSPFGTAPNGSDTLTVTGVRAWGEGAYVSFQGDFPSETQPGGRDRMTLANVDLSDVSFFEFDVLGDYVPTDPGNDITFENINASVVGDYIFLPSYVDGGPGDDTFRFKNVNVNVEAGLDATVEWSIGSYEGNDTIDVSNMQLVSTTAAVEDGFNQTFLYCFGDTVRFRNFELVGGGTFSGGFFDQDAYITGGYLTLVGDNVDLKNVAVHTNGFGGLYLESQEAFVDGLPRDGTYKLANVEVTSASGDQGELYIAAVSGNDHVDVRNSSFESLSVYLGDGDDSLTIHNSSGNMPSLQFGYGGIDAGGGDDAVEIRNSTFLNFLVTLGDGNDRLDLRHCEFGSVAFDLGDGDDTAVVKNTSAGSLFVDGGAGFDTLVALGNVSPAIEFDNFEA